MINSAAAATVTWPSLIVGGLFSGAGLGIVGLIIRQVLPWRKQNIDAQQAVIMTLQQMVSQQEVRIGRLEHQLNAERRTHFIELRRLEARHSAQRALDRHKFNNAETILDSVLNILELSPEKASEAAKLARERRTEYRTSEQRESATIHAAELEAVSLAEAELNAQEKNNGDC